jgi:hypothetical protein
MPDPISQGYNGQKVDCLTRESYFYKSGNYSYRRCQQNKYNTEPNSSMGSFIDGASASDSGNSYVLGRTIEILSLFMRRRFRAAIALEPSRSLFETTVITHEFGHILGLTNLGALFKAAMKTQHMRSIVMLKVV